MKKKLRDLCSSFPKIARLQSPMDNVGTQMFKPMKTAQYIPSSAPPEKRYGIDVDPSSLKHHNEHLDDFQNYGPNEQYLINKILYSPHNLIYVIGGIGVGKTTFTHYLITEILDRLRHEVTHDTSKCPCPIYLDFLDLGAATFIGSDFEKMQVTFSNMLCDRIEAEIESKGHIDPEQELGSVWENLIASETPAYQKNLAISFIVSKLREENAGSARLASNYEETIASRRQIKRTIAANATLRRFYLAALLRYIKATFYQNHPGCFMIIIDNVDREPTAVQHAVKMILKPFARTSNVRVVVNARQTTFYQSLDDGMSEPIDQVAYCGASPLDIVIGRINRFLDNPESYTAFYAPGALPTLVKGLRNLKDSFLQKDWFSSYFLSFTGRSVRKALILAQHLVDNSVYDPYEIGRTGRSRQNDIMRAIIVGPKSTYEWSEAGLIDNLFEVHEGDNDSYLIKLRILRILSIREEVGLKLKPLLTILNGLGYEAELIKDALNEIMPPSKRMIWSDEIRQFDEVEDLVNHSHAHLFITTIGKGYEQKLYKMLEYIQEVMLDTTIDSIEFGHNWDYGRMEDRLKLVSLFCSTLLDWDMRETSSFISSYGPKGYHRAFGSGRLISGEIIESVSRDVDSILRFTVAQPRRDVSGMFSDFLTEHASYYRDRLLKASRFEDEYLQIN